MIKNTKPVEIILHINEDLQGKQIDHLENLLSKDNGITKAQVNPKRRHLMLVDYLPGIVTARDVLSYVRNRGYHAELVGGW